ncbi:MAG TPA: cell division protein FtsA [Candidatus Omnitrophota bacterium]|nr:cell division protein FtsA [Candidatus Omnitrophota bacterium]HRZ15257.1 cell division protein FtsA [Candidatus Omnitrophota bacterium]
MNYICALDIGSSKIAAAVAQLKGKHITQIYFECAPSKGIKQGVIVDSVDLVDAVGKVMKNLKARSGIPIRSLHTNISGKHVITKRSRAIIPLTERGNKVVTYSDIQKVHDQALILGSHIDEELVHFFPLSYITDSGGDVFNPLGLYSHRLEVDLFMISGKLSSIQTVTHVVHQAGYDIRSIFLPGLTTSEIVFASEHGKGWSILCDIGSDVTEIVLCKAGMLKDIRILPLGGDDLTAALSQSLQVPWELAEDLKISYGAIGDPARIPEEKEVLIKKESVYKPVKQRAVCEIITARAQEMCRQLKQALDKDVSWLEVDNFVVAGRTVFQEGFLEMLEATVGVPVRAARISNAEVIPFVNTNDVLSGQKYLTYLTALGLICKQMGEFQPHTSAVPNLPRHPVAKFFHKAKEIYQEYF